MKDESTPRRRSTVRGLTAKEKKATAAKTTKRPRSTLDRSFDKWMNAGK